MTRLYDTPELQSAFVYVLVPESIDRLCDRHRESTALYQGSIEVRKQM